jgi:putative ABC transport system permease protein
MGGAQLIEHFAQDLRYAVRMLRRNPGFTAVAVLTLGLGIGANTAIFSTVNAVLLRPLPYPHAERLVQIWETHPVLHRIQASYPDYMDWRGQNNSFEKMAAYTFEGLQPVNLVAGGEPVQLACSLVSESLLPTLGVAPEIGRNFGADEVRPGHDNVAILSHALWVSRFGARPDIVGMQLPIDGVSVRVVGVLSAAGQFPVWADVLMPVSRLADFDRVSRKHHLLQAIGRLKPGVTVDQAQTEIAGISRRLQSAYPATNSTIGAELVPLAEQVSGAVRRPLLMVMAAVGLVLLIACTNVANLLLARAASRSKEVAIRVALGAGRGRLISQFVTESLLLALLGSALGLAVLAVSAPALRAWTRDFLPRAGDIGIDGSVLLFTMGVAVVAGMVFGLAPAWQLARRDHDASLRQAGRNAAGSSGARRVRAFLVAAEIGMAVVILTGAGLLFRSFSRLLDVDPGFRADHVLSFGLALPPNRYAAYPQIQAFYRQLLPRLRQLPGVAAAELTNALPLTATTNQTRFAVEGAPPPESGHFPVAQFRVVTPGYFGAMTIPLREGRTFSGVEMEATGPPVCMINESMARRFYSGRSAVGRKVVLGVLDPKPQATEIVGVVGDTREMGLAEAAEPQIYFPGFSAAGTVVLRTVRDPLSFSGAARREVHAIDATQPVARMEPMEAILGASLARRRFSLGLLGGFALLALVLACTGLYGVVSYSVEQRTQELGLRQALGGQPGDLIRMIFFEGLLLSAVGVAAGTVVALGAGHVMSGLLYETAPVDPATSAAVGLILGVVSAMACLRPAWRAARVDPMVALRSE